MMTSAAPRPSAARYVKRPPMHPAMRQAMNDAADAGSASRVGPSRAGRPATEARRQPSTRTTPQTASQTAPAAPASVITATVLIGMRRPKTLAKAARFGAALYRREHHLRLALPGAVTVAQRDVVGRLAALEADLDAARRAGRPDYAPRRHVLVLSALFAETASALAGA